MNSESVLFPETEISPLMKFYKKHYCVSTKLMCVMRKYLKEVF